MCLGVVRIRMPRYASVPKYVRVHVLYIIHATVCECACLVTQYVGVFVRVVCTCISQYRRVRVLVPCVFVFLILQPVCPRVNLRLYICLNTHIYTLNMCEGSCIVVVLCEISMHESFTTHIHTHTHMYESFTDRFSKPEHSLICKIWLYMSSKSLTLRSSCAWQYLSAADSACSLARLHLSSTIWAPIELQLSFSSFLQCRSCLWTQKQRV
jgi:hypothetical protein